MTPEGLTHANIILTVIGAGVSAAIPMLAAGAYAFVKLTTKFDGLVVSNDETHERIEVAQKAQNGQLDKHAEAITAIVATCAERTRIQELLAKTGQSSLPVSLPDNSERDD